LSDTEVITGEAPARYAQALLDLAEDAKSIPRVEKDLKSFKKMYDSSARSYRRLRSNLLERLQGIAVRLIFLESFRPLWTWLRDAAVAKLRKLFPQQN